MRTNDPTQPRELRGTPTGGRWTKAQKASAGVSLAPGELGREEIAALDLDDVFLSQGSPTPFALLTSRCTSTQRQAAWENLAYLHRQIHYPEDDPVDLLERSDVDTIADEYNERAYTLEFATPGEDDGTFGWDIRWDEVGEGLDADYRDAKWSILRALARHENGLEPESVPSLGEHIAPRLDLTSASGAAEQSAAA